MTDKLIPFMLFFISFPSWLLAISITKTHNFMVIGCSLKSKLRNFSNIFFGLHLKFYSQTSNCTVAKAQTFRKRWLNILSGSKYFNVTAHFRAVSQAKSSHFITFWHLPRMALPSSRKVAIPNMLLLQIAQNFWNILIRYCCLKLC